MSQNIVENAADLPRHPAPSRRRRPTHAERLVAQRHRRLRYVFFGLASGWGFVTGSVAVLAGLDRAGHTVSAASGLGMRLVVAAVVALAGGIVVSLAYREVVRRGA